MSEDNEEFKKTTHGTQDQETYEVGYKKPPQNTQFQKGVPSPRKGKKKKGYYYDEIFWQIAREEIEVNIGSRTKKMTRIEACIRKMAQLAISGDRAALIHFLETFADNSASKKNNHPSIEWLRRTYDE